MAGLKMPRYIVPFSIIGAGVGFAVIFKDNMGNPRYRGKEKLIGRTVIVTGANTGIGRATAEQFADRGARVLLACRDMEKCEATRKQILDNTINKNIHCKKLDLASMKSVRDFAKDVKETEKRLDILVNNAGIMYSSKMPRDLTEDGFEQHLGVNHFGHFLLTNLLLDSLKDSSPSQVITLASLSYTNGKMKWDDLNSDSEYDATEAYCQSKLANVYFSRELAARLNGTGIRANIVNPGLTRSELGRHMSMYKSCISSFLLSPIWWCLLKSPMEASESVLNCALNPNLAEDSGKYYSGLGEGTLTSPAMDQLAASRLWAVSEKWTRLNSD